MKPLLNSLREYANLIPQPGIMDIIDILVVAYLFYRIILLIRQTAAARRYPGSRGCRPARCRNIHATMEP